METRTATDARTMIDTRTATDTVIGRAAVVSSPADLAVLLRGLRQRHARTRRSPALSYRELATRTGWSHGIIGAYLTGKVLPPVDRLDELARQLGAAPAELGALANARERIADRTLCTPVRPPRQLPAPVPRFIGREPELALLGAPNTGPVNPATTGPATVQPAAGGSATSRSAAGGAPRPGAWLADGPMVVTGPPGVGKTALAVHWAQSVVDAFPGGQLWADLRGSTARPVEPDVVLDQFLVVLGGIAGGGATAYRTLMARRRILVVLDDAVDAAQIRPLLPGGPGCHTVITTRARLTPLVAIDGARPLTVGPMSRDETRRLLTARIGADRVAADPLGAEAICAASAGLPLSLAVAAARVLIDPDGDLRGVAKELAAGDLPTDGRWDRTTEIAMTHRTSTDR